MLILGILCELEEQSINYLLFNIIFYFISSGSYKIKYYSDFYRLLLITPL